MCDLGKPVGAIWERTSKKGTPMMTIKLNNKDYVCFKNNYKDNDRKPDWNIFVSTTKPQKKQEDVKTDNDFPF